MSNVNEILPDIDTKINSDSAVVINDPSECKTFLRPSKSSLTIVTQNIRSLNKNKDDFEILLSQLDVNVDIVVLTECWLSCNDNIPSIPSYNSFKTSKLINQNSGVVIYIKDKIKQVRVSEPLIDNANGLLLEIGKHTGIICVYRPPSCVAVGTFQLSLDHLLNNLKGYNKLILIGDINIDIKNGNTDNRSTEYLNLLASHAMLPTHLLPTRAKNCLDHCFVKTDKKTTSIIYNSSITDHSTVIVNVSNQSVNIQKKQFNTVLKTNYEAVIDELSAINWSETLSQHDEVNLKTKEFLNILTDTYNKHTHIKYISKRKYTLKPWVTPGLLRCLKFRNKLHQKNTKHPDDKALHTIYIRYRNHCNRILKNLKRSYEGTLIKENKHNIKRTWQVVKSICNLDNKSNSAMELLEYASVNDVNAHFANIGKNLANTIINRLNTTEDELVKGFKETNTPGNSLVLLPTDTAEIKRIIVSLKNSKSSGYDNTPADLYKFAVDILCEPIANICNLCMSRGVFPEALKKSIVIPIHKAGNRDSVNNYRPISLLPTLSKILEKVINKRLLEYLEKYQLLSNNQYGFRANKSTTEAIEQLVTHVSIKLDQKEKCVGIFLDLMKAFDTVSIPLLLKKLEYSGVRGVSLDLMQSYLQNRSQAVRIDCSVSLEEPVSYGIPQGSVLGPTLFLIYINSLCTKELQNARIITFADDTVLLFSGKSWSEAQSMAEEGISKVAQWLDSNLLTLNLEKTKFITFSIRNQLIANNFQLKVHSCSDRGTPCNCYILEKTTNIRYLGIMIDGNLNWDTQIDKLKGRVRKLIYIFKKLRHVKDFEILKCVYYSLCQSILSYGILAWGGAAKTRLLDLERAQRYVLKVMFFKPLIYSTSALYLDSQVLTVRQLFIETLILNQHKHPLNSSRLEKRRSDIVYNVQQCRTKFMHQFSNFLGPFIYNKLNKHLLIAKLNKNTCKKTIVTYLKTLNYDNTENLMKVQS